MIFIATYTGHNATQTSDDIRTVRLSINHQKTLWNLNRRGNNLSIKQMLYSTAEQRSKSWPAFHYKLGGRIYSAGFKMYSLLLVIQKKKKKRLTRLQLWPTILNSEYLLLLARRDVEKENKHHTRTNISLHSFGFTQTSLTQTPMGSANGFISLSSLREI